MKKLIGILILAGPIQALAWGGRGHHSICSAASFLVKEPGLIDYLKNKPQMMGHLCNMPDFYWKSLGGQVNALGNPTHFIDVEVLGVKTKEISTDYKKIVSEFTGKPDLFKKDGSTIKSIPQEFGSSWWRVDQFMRMIAALEPSFTTAQPPANPKEEQNNELPYNKLSYDMINWMGVMGHFVGDNSQPFHTTADYDGYEAGHGGIHAFYEDTLVGNFDGDLEALILKEARNFKNPAFLKPTTTIEKMKELSIISNSELPKIFKLDSLVKKSTLVKEKGMQIKTAAERKPAAEIFKKMKPLLVTQMARSAALLANLWDEAYRSAGKPKLSAYKSYRYPFNVDFVAPDYFEIPKESDAKK